MRISDWSSDVCSSDLAVHPAQAVQQLGVNRLHFGAHRRRLQRPIHQLLALGKSALAHVAERKPCHGGSVPTIAVQRALEQPDQIGRASCRERVCKYVSISEGAVSLKKK